MKVALASCRSRVVIEGRFWAEDIPVEILPSRIRFYRWLSARARGRYAVHYADTLAGLVAVQQGLDRQSREGGLL